MWLSDTEINITVNVLPMSIVLALYRYLNDNKLNPLSCILDFHFFYFLCVCRKHLLFILPGTYIYIHFLDITQHITQTNICVCCGIQCDRNMVGR